MLPFLQTPFSCQLGGPRPALLVLLLPRLLPRLVPQSLCLVGPDPCSVGWAFYSQIVALAPFAYSMAFVAPVLRLFLSSPPSFPAPEKALYDPPD